MGSNPSRPTRVHNRQNRHMFPPRSTSAALQVPAGRRYCIQEPRKLNRVTYGVYLLKQLSSRLIDANLPRYVTSVAFYDLVVRAFKGNEIGDSSCGNTYHCICGTIID